MIIPLLELIEKKINDELKDIADLDEHYPITINITEENSSGIVLIPHKLIIDKQLNSNKTQAYKEVIEEKEITQNPSNNNYEIKLDNPPNKKGIDCHVLVETKTKNSLKTKQEQLLKESTDYEINLNEDNLKKITIKLQNNLILSDNQKLIIKCFRINLINTQEFKQQFSIIVKNENLEKVEKIAALIIGIILISETELISSYQDSNSNSKAQTSSISNTYNINQISFLEQTYFNEDNFYKIELKFSIFGQMKIVKNILESDPKTIKEVTLRSQ